MDFTSLSDLKTKFAQAGHLSWIGLRPAQGAPMVVVADADVLAERGLKGDRRSQRSGGKRQVTLFQIEHLPVVASLLGRDAVAPELLRRNLGIRGINLLALRGAQFRIGEVLFEGSGPCAPCRRLEQTLGLGGFNAARGHGGITARALSSGTIHVGDALSLVDADVPND